MARWSRQLGGLEQDPFIDYKFSFKLYKRKKLDHQNRKTDPFSNKRQLK
jgi:hypothetical protein